MAAARSGPRDRVAKKIAGNTKAAHKDSQRRHAAGTAKGSWRPPNNSGGY